MVTTDLNRIKAVLAEQKKTAKR